MNTPVDIGTFTTKTESKQFGWRIKQDWTYQSTGSGASFDAPT
ncbi:hypothetical protein [Acinetobacter sp.]|nr:hypothetical protein [Acinetobacter sp.]